MSFRCEKAESANLQCSCFPQTLKIYKDSELGYTVMVI